MASVTWNDKEVTRQPQRAIVATLAVILGTLGALLGLLVLLIVIPLSLPFHIVLRLFGHRGFYEGGGSYSVPWWGLLLMVIVYGALILAL